jgi:ABC-2 type transport system ATP-binding protein
MIAMNKLSFAYPKKQQLFTNLTLELKAGSITGILGSNGAGKTTLLKLLSGLLVKNDGEIEINGQNPFKRNVAFLQDMYFVPEAYYLAPVKISNYVKGNCGFYPKFNLDKFNKILNGFELRANDKLHQLSYGQKKKFIVAFALATNCALLIFDEPTNGLDIPSKAIFRKTMAGFIDDNQLVIMSTHQVKDVENLIDNLVILKNGKVVFHKTTEKITDNYIFTTTRSIDEKSALYSEQIPGGYKSISKRTNGTPTEIDIELLFNAVDSGAQLKMEVTNE